MKSSSILNYYHTEEDLYALRKHLRLRLIEIDWIEGVKEINSTLVFNYEFLESPQYILSAVKICSS
jgi:hypothetical protein